jgi:Na+-translocating ferredoxin:NAD+ oxidoreductase subunit E
MNEIPLEASSAGWKNNSTVQLLGLCPLLIAATSATVGFALGLTVTATLVFVAVAAAPICTRVSPAIRIAVQLALIAAAVTCIELLLAAVAFELRNQLGVFLPLLAGSCVVLHCTEISADKTARYTTRNVIRVGLGTTAVLTVLGALRSVIGAGTVFAVPAAAAGLPLALLPAGAFMLTAGLLAIRNIVTGAAMPPAPPSQPTVPAAGSRRVRVTGPVR